MKARFRMERRGSGMGGKATRKAEAAFSSAQGGA